MDKEKIKQALHALCHEFLDKQREQIDIALKAAQDSGNDETKSTTGDKHETGRAMMQLEQEKIGHQLKDLEIVAGRMERIPTNLSTEKILPGNVVITDKGNFYIAIAAGKLAVGDQNYFGISASSPLGALLLKSEPGKTVKMNNVEYKLLDTF